MKVTIDYTNSPAKKFDAVEDIKNYLGPTYDMLAAIIKAEKNKGDFLLGCAILGIHGFPVEAWYDHFHGEGSWKNGEKQ